MDYNVMLQYNFFYDIKLNNFNVSIIKFNKSILFTKKILLSKIVGQK